MRRLPRGTLAVLLLVLAGCQRLNYEKETTLDPSTDPLEYTFDGPPGEAKVNVKVDSNQPVNVWVVLEEDKDSALAVVLSTKKPAKALAGQENTKAADFEATIPAKKNFVVLVTHGKGMHGSANVRLNVKSK